MKKDNLKSKKMVHFRNRKLFRSMDVTPTTSSTSKALAQLEELVARQK
jgi:hypothetical protein